MLVLDDQGLRDGRGTPRGQRHAQQPALGAAESDALPRHGSAAQLRMADASERLFLWREGCALIPESA